MPTYWRIEVLTKTYHIVRGDEEVWRPMTGSNNQPYDWSTKREADAMVDMLFDPGKRERVRVVGYEAR